MTGGGTSVGVGMTTSGRLGVGSARTTSTTELARQFEPGAEPTILGGGVAFGSFVLGVPGIVAIADGALGAVIFGAFLLIGAMAVLTGGHFNARAERRAWLEKVRMYEHGWICLQCGKLLDQCERAGAS